MPEPLIELRAATVELGGRKVLDGYSFTAGAGEVVLVTGPNGAGKSTLLRALSGELRGGELRLGGDDASALSPAVLARRRAWLEQQPTCAWGLTAAEVVALGGPDVGGALAQVGATHLHDRTITELSGGERRLVHVARCLAQLGAPKGKVLLLDEPDAGLDAAHRQKLAEALRGFADAGGSVVVATHGEGWGKGEGEQGDGRRGDRGWGDREVRVAGGG